MNTWMGKQGQGLRAAPRAVAMAVALTLALPAASMAAPPAAGKSKVVQALIGAAQKEFEAGNFERAGELYLEIWHQDQETRAALYNAARAYQLGGKIDRADELYRELLAIPDMDPALKAKSQTQLEGVQLKRAERKADEADRAEKSGQYAAAAGLWAEAVRTYPGKMAWLVRQARALHLAGQTANAITAYDKYLASAGEGAADRAQVQAWRQELATKATPVAPKNEPEPDKPAPVQPDNPAPGPIATTPDAAKADGQPTPVPKPVQPPKSEAFPIVPVAVLSVGGVLTLAGAAIWIKAHGDDSTLQDALSPSHAAVYTKTQAQTEASRIHGNYVTGGVLAGVGIVGVGVWLLLRQPKSRVAVLPTVNGATVAWRF